MTDVRNLKNKKMIAKRVANALILVGCVIIAIFLWRAIDKILSRNQGQSMVIEILTEQVKQDSIKAESYRKLADSLQEVALKYQAQATIEHQAKLDLLKKQQLKEGKKVLTATARQAVQYFVASVDTGSKEAPELIARAGDTLAQISYMTIRKANLLFVELDYSRQAIEEHKVFEDDLIGVINDINESANTYKLEADTWKKSTDDLKTINQHMQAINNEDKRKLKNAKLFNKILTGALGLAAAKIIFL